MSSAVDRRIKPNRRPCSWTKYGSPARIELLGRSPKSRVLRAVALKLSYAFRHWAGVLPMWFLNARWKAASDW